MGLQDVQIIAFCSYLGFTQLINFFGFGCGNDKIVLLFCFFH